MEPTTLGQLNEVELLAFFGSCNMRRDEGVHEGLEVWPPKLRKALTNLPVSSLFAFTQSAHWRKSFVQSSFEPLDLVVFWPQVVPRELEERVCDLQHQDMGVVVLVAHQDALTGAAHAMLAEMLFQSLQTGNDGRVLLWLGLLDAECVVG